MMKHLLAALLSLFVLAAPGYAEVVATKKLAPTRADMATWKRDVLSIYEKVVYLNADGTVITEEMFNTIVVNEKRAFRMVTESTSPKLMTISLLTEAETKAAQAPVK